MKKYSVIFLFFFSSLLLAQGNTYYFDNYFVKVDGQTLKAFKADSTILYQRKFSDPTIFALDLDSDYVNEIVAIENQLINEKKKYTLFVYNTLDSLYLTDSIYSGSTKPYQVFSDDLNTILLATGNAAYDSLNAVDSLSYIPLNFWKFEDGTLYLANASVYELYITENSYIIDKIEKFYSQSGKNCQSARKIKGAIASGFINYYSAGEITFASQFLKNYYLCSDIDNFKQFLLKSFK